MTHTFEIFQNSRSSSPALGSQQTSEQPYIVRSRNNSYMNAVKNDSLTSFEDGISSKVKAGTQKVLQVFITNAANVFLLEPPVTDVLLEEQVFRIFINSVCFGIFFKNVI